MKQLLVIAIALASTNAFASRARVQSLGNSAHILDTQSIFSNPAKMFLMGDFVSLESGKTATNNAGTIGTNPNDNAEGTLVRSMGDAKWALALGHKSENASAFGSRGIMDNPFVASTGDVTEQQNPVEFSYGMKSGDMTWAATLVYSNFNDKKAEDKENSAGLRFGALMGSWDFAAGVGLASEVKSKTADKDFKGTGAYSLYAGNTMGNLYAYAEAVMAGAKLDNHTTGAQEGKATQTKFTVGVVDSNKKDGNEFFYGAKLVKIDFKDEKAGAASEQKISSLSLPVIVGLEAEATSWLTLRGSLTQNVLVSQSKTEIGGATTAPGTKDQDPSGNTTVAAVGAGLKFNKITVDGSLSGLTGGTANQQLDGNNLLSTVGLTYMF